MSRPDLFALVGVVLVLLALYAFAAQTHLLRRILAHNVLGSGVCLSLVAIARRAPGAPDPVPHAMVLTGIVVAVAATAFGLVLARRIYDATGGTRLPEDDRG